MRGLGTRQAEEAARLVEHVAEGVEPAIEGDQVEEIAMLAGGGVGPFAGGAGTGLRSRETDIEAAAGGVPNIAHQPVAAVAAAVGKIVAADAFGIAREAPRQIGGPAGHDAGHDRLPSRRVAVGDAHERMALHQRAEDGGAASRRWERTAAASRR